MSVRIEEQNVCAFCQKRSGEVRRMIGSKTGVFICDECVRALPAEEWWEELEEEKKWS